MIVKLLGTNRVSYVSKKTGNLVEGTDLHFARTPSPREIENGFNGVFVQTELCRKGTPAPAVFEVGKQYELLYESLGGKYADLAAVKEVSDSAE